MTTHSLSVSSPIQYHPILRTDRNPRLSFPVSTSGWHRFLLCVCKGPPTPRTGLHVTWSAPRTIPAGQATIFRWLTAWVLGFSQWAALFPVSDRSHCILSRKPLPACQVHFKEDTVICEVFPRRLPSYNPRVAPSYRTCSQPQGFIPVFPFYGIKTLVEPEAGLAELLLNSCFYRCVR